MSRDGFKTHERPKSMKNDVFDIHIQPRFTIRKIHMSWPVKMQKRKKMPKLKRKKMSAKTRFLLQE